MNKRTQNPVIVNVIDEHAPVLAKVWQRWYRGATPVIKFYFTLEVAGQEIYQDMRLSILKSTTERNARRAAHQNLKKIQEFESLP